MFSDKFQTNSIVAYKFNKNDQYLWWIMVWVKNVQKTSVYNETKILKRDDEHRYHFNNKNVIWINPGIK